MYTIHIYVDGYPRQSYQRKVMNKIKYNKVSISGVRQWAILLAACVRYNLSFIKKKNPNYLIRNLCSRSSKISARSLSCGMQQIVTIKFSAQFSVHCNAFIHQLNLEEQNLIWILKIFRLKHRKCLLVKSKLYIYLYMYVE